MLLLTSTSDLLQVVTDAAVTVDCHASFMDYNATVVTPGRTNTAITTATTTTVVAAPGASVQRNVRTLHIRNKHATSSVIVTIRHTDGTTPVDIHAVTLIAGASLEYIEGIGFFTLEPALPLGKALASDQSNSTTTLTEVTGIALATAIGTFYFRYLICYQAAATTTGVRFSVNYDGTVTVFVANWHAVDAVATASTAAVSQAAVGAAAQVYSAYSARAKSTTGWGSTISVDAANSDMFAVIEGLMVVTVAGNIELWHGSEVAAASTVKAGSSLVLVKTG